MSRERYPYYEESDENELDDTKEVAEETTEASAEEESLDDFLDIDEGDEEPTEQESSDDLEELGAVEEDDVTSELISSSEEDEILDDFLLEEDEKSSLEETLDVTEIVSVPVETEEKEEVFDLEKEAAMLEEETEDQMMIRMRLEALDENPTPFEEFVARYSTPVKIDIPEPHAGVKKALMITLKSVQRDTVPRIFPLIGEAGSGKTHFYWHLKDLEEKEKNDWDIIYIPSPPSSVRIPLHVLTCILDEIGTNLINVAAGEIMRKFSQKKGLFRRDSTEGIVQRSIVDYPGLRAEIISALVHIAKGEKESLIAKRWLLGGWISEKELDKIGGTRLIEADDIVLAAIKVLLENYDKTVVLYFDEIEIPYRTRGVDIEIAFLENLKRLYNEVSSILIVTACLKEIWPRIYETLDSALRTRMGNVFEFDPFSADNLEEFYIQSMNRWWIEEQNIDPPKDPFFPLKEEDFSKILQTSKGNPRLCIKLIRSFLKRAVAIGLRKELPATEDIAELTAKEAPLAALLGTDISIEVNPPSIIAGMIETIISEGRQRGIVVEKRENPEFIVEAKKRTIAAILEKPDIRVGLEVASVRNFDRKGGVAAYYALDRLREAIEHGFIDRGILAVPHKTTGSKYQLTLFSLGDRISVLEMNRDEAQRLIQTGLLGEISNKGLELVKMFFK